MFRWRTNYPLHEGKLNWLEEFLLLLSTFFGAGEEKGFCQSRGNSFRRGHEKDRTCGKNDKNDEWIWDSNAKKTR